MRCAEWARSEDVDPVGTAGDATGWLLVEWPLPWPRAAEDVPGLAPVFAALAGSGVRLQLVVPDGQGGSRRRVVLHRRGGTDGWFDGCTRHAREVASAEVVDAAVALVAGEHGDGHSAPGIDVLVCGHGTRDRCCGSLGTALAVKPGPGVHVRRTSHLGGHRFAPTGLVLPEATSWAFLDVDALRRVVNRSGPLDDLLPRYRGCAALGSPAAQALDRVAFAEIGWSWLDHRRRALDVGPDRVRLEAVGRSGDLLAWEAVVAAGRTLPVPECGREIADARKTETEVVLRGAARVVTTTSQGRVSATPDPG
jgi:hypothetical protein